MRSQLTAGEDPTAEAADNEDTNCANDPSKEVLSLQRSGELVCKEDEATGDDSSEVRSFSVAELRQNSQLASVLQQPAEQSVTSTLIADKRQLPVSGEEESLAESMCPVTAVNSATGGGSGQPPGFIPASSYRDRGGAESPLAGQSLATQPALPQAALEESHVASIYHSVAEVCFFELFFFSPLFPFFFLLLFKISTTGTTV